MTAADVLAFYAAPGLLTSGGIHEQALRELPGTVPELRMRCRGS